VRDDPGICVLETQANCPNDDTTQWSGDGIDCLVPSNPCTGACCTGGAPACANVTEQLCEEDFPGSTWLRYMACNNPGINCNLRADVCSAEQGTPGCHLPPEKPHPGFGMNSTVFVFSDLSIFIQLKAADSFVPTGGASLNRACWWGAYTTSAGANCILTPDAFTIVYYNDNAGLPGTVAGSFAVSATRGMTGDTIVTGTAETPFIRPEWEYRATHPVLAVTAGNCMWFEVTNNSGFTTCRWFWETAAPGDALSVQDINQNGIYQAGEENDFDLSFCVTSSTAGTDMEVDDCN
jgi:hypothetical protein